MEVKKGYKQTDVGVIPDDWEVKTFKDVCWVNQGLQIAISNRLKNPSLKSKIYITIQYLNQGKEVEYIDDYSPSVCCEKHDVLMTRTGNTGIVVSGVEGVFHNNFFKLNYDKQQLDKDFLIYYLTQKRTQKIILANAGTSTIPDLNHNDFYSIPIYYPPTKTEQTAIANVLNDADALIISLEKLIAKKQNIKQGAMQLLLTGKKRLPGFIGKWEKMKLPEVCWFQEGPGVRNSQFTSSGVKLLNGTNITSGKLTLDNTDRYISDHEAYGIYSHFLANEGDLIIACSGITVEKFHEKVTIIEKQHLPLCMNTSTMRFKVTGKKLSKFYLLWFLKSQSFKSQIGGQITGSAQLNFGPSHVKKVNIKLPKPDEQTAIAQVLNDMDAEIEVLEQKLTKYRMIKQRMMQELLTGKTRLI